MGDRIFVERILIERINETINQRRGLLLFTFRQDEVPCWQFVELRKQERFGRQLTNIEILRLRQRRCVWPENNDLAGMQVPCLVRVMSQRDTTIAFENSPLVPGLNVIFVETGKTSHCGGRDRGIDL